MWVIYRVCVMGFISGLFLEAECGIWGFTGDRMAVYDWCKKWRVKWRRWLWGYPMYVGMAGDWDRW